MAKNIVVLGAGYGGVLTAKKLAKKVKKLKLEKDINISIIDKNPFHTMLTELHEVAANRVEEDSIKMNLEKIFANRKVDVILDEVTSIDFKSKKLTGKNKSYSYDYLVLGTGSKPAFFGVEGAQENSFSLWSYDDAIRLKEHFIKTFRAAERETDPKVKKEMLTFYVVGGGFTGVEMVGELAEWMPFLCEDFHIDPKSVEICLVDMLDRIITSLPEKYSNRAANRLKKMGVKIMLKQGVVKVDKNAITLKSGDRSVTNKTRTVIWTAGIEGAEVLGNSDIKTVARGRVETNEFLQAKDKENVYVVGDNVFFIPEGETDPVPQMVENAEASSGLVASNIMAVLSGGKQEKYQPKFHGMMVCIGGRHGTAYVGTHKSKFGLPSFFAMFSKHFINIIYFIQVLGWNKVYNYLLHEVFRIKNNRSFVGGYMANYAPTFWSMPLRMFLGISWLIEGLNKLPQIIADPTNIFLFSIPSADGVTAASGTTGASAADAAATYGEALPVPEFVTNIVNWSMSTFVAPIAPFFQAMMVIAEIIIGILLIIGLFTAAASVVQSALCVMIYVSGMAGVTILWYLFSGIALIGVSGTGMTFSTDYYVMPWLKKQWKKIGFVKKWYLYND